MTAFIRVYNVSLELPTDVHKPGGKGYADLRASLSGSVRYQTTVLSGINFAVADGDRVGVMGLNGAGKTTLLRVLNGAFPPTAGVVRTEGTRQSLLNPMLGFSEYASVAENIFLRGTAMGLRYRQLKIAARDILEFAGLADRAEYPLYSLSSGQRMRLGFSISTAVQPDILLMDEWLSTGDASFVERAQKRLTDRFDGSRIAVIASHSTSLLRKTCNKAIVLDKGRMRFFGDIAEGLDAYREVISRESAQVRDAAAGADPILFGSSTGVVERIRASGESLEVQGWAIDERGREPAVLCLEFGGQRHLVETFERLQREDVSSYLGKSSGKYGFRVALALDGPVDPASVVDQLRISVGRNASRLGPPLPLVQASIIETA